jgi:hypothetical protein
MSGSEVIDPAMSGPAVSGPPRLEVRWIRPGALDDRMVDWFARFPISTESRVDNYLCDPDIDGLSVKVRGGRTLEVKARLRRRGELVVPGRARGFLESWQRWSFHAAPATWADVDSPAWISVSKVRRVSYVHANGDLSPRGEDHEHEIGCAVELTDVATAGRRWWTLSFEANGPEGDIRGLLETTALMVLGEPIPGATELRPHESSSYANWLRDHVR